MKTQSTTVSNICLNSALKKAVFLGLALLVINGCSDKSKPSTQIVAKVNDDEITVHQLNNALAKYPATPAEKVANVRLDLVGRLVNEQLTVQQALLHKLDRSSEVIMQIEAAKREILTKAYLKEVVSGLPKITPEDTKKFYDANPALFSCQRAPGRKCRYASQPARPAGYLTGFG